MKEELIQATRSARDEEGAVLVWIGDVPKADGSGGRRRASGSSAADRQPLLSGQRFARHPDAERRQLTVLFCDLVDSTALVQQVWTPKTCVRWYAPIKRPAPR